MEKLIVELGDRSYPIFIGNGLLKADLIIPYIKSHQAMIVTNTTVAKLYLEPLKQQLLEAGITVGTAILPDGEEFKTLETLQSIFDALLQQRHHRSTTLIALGGGVVGDMTGFAAATYQRGVGFLQIPTTLLSQVDSSVGGKTGVNHPLGKNMIGAFYQPAAVCIDINTLNTLPKRELSAGLAEVVKYALIADTDFLVWLETHMEKLLACDPNAMAHAIRRSCEIKAAVVAEDETEQDRRAILNFGHTFGHAIETAEGYGNWLHGEAVGAGMVMALDLSCRLGFISAKDAARGMALIEKAQLPIEVPSDMSPEKFLNLMGMDKKVQQGKLRLVLLRSLGDADIFSDFNTEKLDETLNTFVILKNELA